MRSGKPVAGLYDVGQGFLGNQPERGSQQQTGQEQTGNGELKTATGPEHNPINLLR
jgi:hypothetical protein